MLCERRVNDRRGKRSSFLELVRVFEDSSVTVFADVFDDGMDEIHDCVVRLLGWALKSFLNLLRRGCGRCEAPHLNPTTLYTCSVIFGLGCRGTFFDDLCSRRFWR